MEHLSCFKSTLAAMKYMSIHEHGHEIKSICVEVSMVRDTYIYVRRKQK